jgi:hypothetical protein
VQTRKEDQDEGEEMNETERDVTQGKTNTEVKQKEIKLVDYRDNGMKGRRQN